ncbi:ISAs1 family transposase [Thorsellia kenyensis]|uniref:ISAs1 family transposase n=1 Tax=Thorsellia kenyensis TaxID=1549888 RepID=A0ABV6C6F7_9GAMM
MERQIQNQSDFWLIRKKYAFALCPEVRVIIKITRERQLNKSGKTESETLYYISSRNVDVEETAKAIRHHWGVENNAHWLLDVTFKEDDSRIRKDDGAENVGIIRRFCLNLCKLNPRKNSMVGKIKKCGWSDEYRQEVIFGQ